ncbi:MAG: hypothetical protein F6K31_03370 [Symploca sp. SIO2G7]|nr:hypothetical protein [Symploca sp. SIO2G7]
MTKLTLQAFVPPRHGDAGTRGWGDGEMGRWGDGELGETRKIFSIPNSQFPIPNFPFLILNS